MADTYTVSATTSFTETHARHMASKVAADLKRVQRFYGQPSDQWIADYEAELIAVLKGGYLDTVTYGFRRDGNWIAPTLRYTARELGSASANDDDPGRVLPGASVQGAVFYSYMTRTSAWSNLSDAARTAFESNLPIRRSGAPEPGVSGKFSGDRTYSAGGRALERFSVRSYA